ncbi:hypothetical protein [Paucibacter sp. Y2R2-4]|uniref:hypothetical protein n=1 Tax=Paucibacter sp. Y2R2-4 TaxID=2893553 RepID=UPI0021E4A305|nr:hypothetical protein [Paucibacter sp. Y2R2-4]MCV2351002.1 hypothetical protein [Paucibacter sp. Y2R2-4]
MSSKKKVVMTSIARRRVWLSLAWAAGVALASGPAVAAPDDQARKFVVISLLGDKLQVVSRQSKIGSHLDSNLRESFELNGGVFDQTALVTIDAQIKQIEPKATVFALKLASADVLGDPANLLEGGRFVSPAVLEPVLKQLQASHLLLVRRHRGELIIKTLREKQGSGMLEGLGFFIDRETPVTDGQNSETYRGFLAPFTYFKVSLINLSSGKLERESIVTQSEARISHRKEAAADPWEVMSNVEKLEFLRQQLNLEVTALLPALLTEPQR